MGELPWPAWEIDRIYISPMIKTVTGIPSRIYGLFSKCFLDENNPTLLLLNNHRNKCCVLRYIRVI